MHEFIKSIREKFRLFILTRKGERKKNFEHLSAGDSRMGCAALSPSFHGNLLLWKQALEQNQELGEQGAE